MELPRSQRQPSAHKTHILRTSWMRECFSTDSIPSLAEFLLNSRDPSGDYAITRLKIAPSARETESIRRRQGRYRRQRNHVLREIQQKYPYGKLPTWYELRGEAKTFREQTNYDSAQEDTMHHEKIRGGKYKAYEKLQEARRQDQKPQ